MPTPATVENLASCSSAGKASVSRSYLLIGFWYHKPSANAAAIKAFVVVRVGDFGFSLGIFAIFTLIGSTDFESHSPGAPGVTGKPSISSPPQRTR